MLRVANFFRVQHNRANNAEVIMRKKDRSQVAGVICRDRSDGVFQVQAEAIIEHAIRQIQACQKQVDRKALVEESPDAAADLISWAGALCPSLPLSAVFCERRAG